MNGWRLAEIITPDRLVHQGVVGIPARPGKRALLWIHGLTSTFYNNIPLLTALQTQGEPFGIAVAAFNNRGHDFITDVRKLDRRKRKGYTHVNAGSGYESFAESVYDIQAGVAYLAAQGYSRVIVAGHSSGANKVCYFAGRSTQPQVAGVILAGPLSDRLGVEPELLARRRLFMQRLVREGRGNELLNGYHYFPITPRRYLSLFGQGTPEDTFDYGDVRPRLHWFARIRVPLLVVLSGADENLDRPAEQVRAVFDAYARSPQYQSLILPGALHSFTGTEESAARAMMQWVATL